MTVEQSSPGGSPLPSPPRPSESQADPDEVLELARAITADMDAVALRPPPVVHHERMVVTEADLADPATRARLADMLERTARAAAAPPPPALEGRRALSQAELEQMARDKLLEVDPAVEPTPDAVSEMAAAIDRETRHPREARRKERRHAPESGADGPVDPIELRKAALEVLQAYDAQDLVADPADPDADARVGPLVAALREALRGKRP